MFNRSPPKPVIRSLSSKGKAQRKEFIPGIAPLASAPLVKVGSLRNLNSHSVKSPNESVQATFSGTNANKRKSTKLSSFSANSETVRAELLEKIEDREDDVREKSKLEVFRLRLKAFLAYTAYGVVYEWSLLFLSIASCLLFIYQTYADKNDAEEVKRLNAIEFATTIIFTFDFCLSLFIADHRLEQLRSFFSMVDLLTVIPTWATIGTTPPSFHDINDPRTLTLYILNLLKTTRILRPLRVRRKFQAIEDEVQRATIDMSYRIFIMILFNTGLIQYLERHVQNFDFHTWMYFLWITTSTVGYGDISAHSIAGRAAIMYIVCFSIVVIPQMTNDLLAKMAKSSVYARAVYTPKVNSRHIIICGDLSSTAATELFEELFHPDHQNYNLYAVVLYSGTQTSEMKGLINNPLYENNIVYLEGTVLFDRDLRRAVAEQAEAILLFTNKFTTTPDRDDAKTILQHHSIRRYIEEKKGYTYVNEQVTFCVQLVRPENMRHFAEGGISLECATEHVICLNEIKMGIIAKTVIFPGTAALIMNLTFSFADDTDSESESEDDDDDDDEDEGKPMLSKFIHNSMNILKGKRNESVAPAPIIGSPRFISKFEENAPVSPSGGDHLPTPSKLLARKSTAGQLKSPMVSMRGGFSRQGSEAGSVQGNAKDARRKLLWTEEYEQGCAWEIYTTDISPAFEGVIFKNLVHSLYEKLGIILIGLQIEDLANDTNPVYQILGHKPKNRARTVLNPAEYVFPSSTKFKLRGLVIAKNQSSADLSQVSGKITLLKAITTFGTNAMSIGGVGFGGSVRMSGSSAGFGTSSMGRIAPIRRDKDGATGSADRTGGNVDGDGGSASKYGGFSSAGSESRDTPLSGRKSGTLRKENSISARAANVVTAFGSSFMGGENSIQRRVVGGMLGGMSYDINDNSVNMRAIAESDNSVSSKNSSFLVPKHMDIMNSSGKVSRAISDSAKNTAPKMAALRNRKGHDADDEYDANFIADHHKKKAAHIARHRKRLLERFDDIVKSNITVQEKEYQLELEFLSSHYYLRKSTSESGCTQAECTIATSVLEQIEHCHNHIIITGSGLGNLYDLIKPLRDRELGRMKYIVILTPTDIPSATWQRICVFDGIMIVKGTPLEEEDIRRAGVFRAQQVVILANSWNAAAARNRQKVANTFGGTSNVATMAGLEALLDSDTIFTYKAVKRMNDSAQCVVEFVKDDNINYLNPETGLINAVGDDYKSSPQFAAGELFVSSLLDTVVCQAFYNPHLVNIINRFICAKDTNELVVAAAQNVKKAGVHKVAPIDQIIGSSLYQIELPARFSNCRYGVLFRKLAAQGVIPLGLYRAVPRAAMFLDSPGYLNKQPYVYTNPPATTEVDIHDKVFVLSPKPLHAVKHLTEEEIENEQFMDNEVYHALHNPRRAHREEAVKVSKQRWILLLKRIELFYTEELDRHRNQLGKIIDSVSLSTGRLEDTKDDEIDMHIPSSSESSDSDSSDDEVRSVRPSRANSMFSDTSRSEFSPGGMDNDNEVDGDDDDEDDEQEGRIALRTASRRVRKVLGPGPRQMKEVVDTFLPIISVMVDALDLKFFYMIRNYADKYSVRADEDGYFRLGIYFCILRDSIDAMVKINPKYLKSHTIDHVSKRGSTELRDQALRKLENNLNIVEGKNEKLDLDDLISLESSYSASFSMGNYHSLFRSPPSDDPNDHRLHLPPIQQAINFVDNGPSEVASMAPSAMVADGKSHGMRPDSHHHHHHHRQHAGPGRNPSHSQTHSAEADADKVFSMEELDNLAATAHDEKQEEERKAHNAKYRRQVNAADGILNEVEDVQKILSKAHNYRADTDAAVGATVNIQPNTSGIAAHQVKHNSARDRDGEAAYAKSLLRSARPDQLNDVDKLIADATLPAKAADIISDMIDAIEIAIWDSALPDNY